MIKLDKFVIIFFLLLISHFIEVFLIHSSYLYNPTFIISNNNQMPYNSNENITEDNVSDKLLFE